MQPQNNKKKGKVLENFTADKLREYGIDNRAVRDGASGAGTREKADIITVAEFQGRNLGIECKNHKSLAIPAWWKQCEQLETINRLPILVYKLPRRPISDTLVSLRIDDFLAILKQAQEPKINNPDKEIVWKAKRAIEATKAFIKELE